jgi:hypothetical protein
MSNRDDLIELEKQAWQALATDGAAAAEFYAEVLAEDVLVLLPGGMVVDDREAVIDSMRGAPWTSFDLSDERVIDLTDDSAMVAYRVTARRPGQDDYTALLSSTYVQEDGAWRMAVHQQSPV